jgi:flagellar assembly protein FliH
LSAPVRKFAFDTVFDADGAVLSEGARTKSFAIEEVEAERAAAYAAGKKDETARAEAQTADALTRIASSAQALAQRFAAERGALMADAAALALAAARTAAGAALDQFGEARVSAALEAALESFIGAPRVIVRIAPVLEHIKPALEEAARTQGFDGAFLVRTDPGVRVGDVSIDWGESAIALSSAEAFARVEALVAERLAQTGEHA